MKDNHSRTIAKTISWRIIATLTTAILVLIFTGSLAIAAGVGSAEAASKMVFYYAHERAWNKISWGKAAE